MYELQCEWTGGMAFCAHVGTHDVIMDADAQFGGHDGGARPKPLLLAALAGCSGMDVVSILKKMREPLSWHNMRVAAENEDEEPHPYRHIKITYEFKKSDGLNDTNVRKAVDLSFTKYCGVAAVLKKAIPVEYDIQYV